MMKMNTIQNLSNLKGRRALITGATGALGRVMADTLAELGADLILIDQLGSDFESIKMDLSDRWDIKVECYICDLEQQGQRDDLLKKIVGLGKGLNILINNAAFVGTSDLKGWGVPFEEQSIDTWRRALEVNLTAVFDLCQRLTPLLKASNGGSIINIASIYGVYGPDWELYKETNMSNPAAYGASKGGLIQLTRWLSTTIAPYVRVNAISPGGIFRMQPEIFVDKYEAKTPLKRMGSENDIRGAIAYLASDLSSYVTGHNLIIDGGYGIC